MWKERHNNLKHILLHTCLLLYITYLGCGYIRHSEDSASLFVSYCIGSCQLQYIFETHSVVIIWISIINAFHSHCLFSLIPLFFYSKNKFDQIVKINILLIMERTYELWLCIKKIGIRNNFYKLFFIFLTAFLLFFCWLKLRLIIIIVILDKWHILRN